MLPFPLHWFDCTTRCSRNCFYGLCLLYNTSGPSLPVRRNHRWRKLDVGMLPTIGLSSFAPVIDLPPCLPILSVLAAAMVVAQLASQCHDLRSRNRRHRRVRLCAWPSIRKRSALIPLPQVHLNVPRTVVAIVAEISLTAIHRRRIEC